MKLAALPVLLAASVTCAAAPAPEDFAFGIELGTPGGAGIYRLALPEPVYRATRQPQLGDLRVFDAHGTPVPYSIAAPTPGDAGVAAASLPFFPIASPAGGESAPTGLRIEVDAAGAVVQVHRDRVVNDAVDAYLVDASAIHAPISALTLGWSADGSHFIARLRVEASEDLSNWSEIVPAATIARLQHGAHTLIQNVIVLPGGRHRYLRIGWTEGPAPVTLSSVLADIRAGAAPAPLTWMTLRGRPAAAAEDLIEYDAGGRFPVTGIDLEFADPNDAARVEVASRPTPGQPWRTAATALFYNLRAGGTALQGAPVPIAAVDDRWWSARVRREGRWRPDRLPRLKLGWQAHELTFLAHGSGPYLLAFGNPRIGPAAESLDALIRALDPQQRGAAIATARVGLLRDLGGATRLEPVREVPWRSYLLWAVLIGAVIALAAFALRVAGDLRRGT